MGWGRGHLLSILTRNVEDTIRVSSPWHVSCFGRASPLRQRPGALLFASLCALLHTQLLTLMHSMHISRFMIPLLHTGIPSTHTSRFGTSIFLCNRARFANVARCIKQCHGARLRNRIPPVCACASAVLDKALIDHSHSMSEHQLARALSHGTFRGFPVLHDFHLTQPDRKRPHWGTQGVRFAVSDISPDGTPI